MEQHSIILKNVISHGKITVDFADDMLHILTQSQNTHFHEFELPLNSYIQVPQKFKLPLRIDMRIKMDVPSMYLILGKGHLTFGTSFLDNRRIGDIVEPDNKKTSVFENNLEMDTFHDISVIYDYKLMQILVNGKEQFYSKKEKYIKSPMLDKINHEGFDLKIAGSKQTCLTIASLTVTEFDKDELANLRSGQNTDNSGICLAIDKKVKPDFEECISKLSPVLQNKIKEINDYLLDNKILKIKRKIEGTSEACKISYTSTHGFSYSLHISDDIMDHFFLWYMVSNYSYENKYMGRKNDLTIETLNKAAETAPDIAERLFSYYDECFGCGANCSAKTVYKYAGNKKVVCHGKMIMNMKNSTFQDLQIMFKILNDILNGL